MKMKTPLVLMCALGALGLVLAPSVAYAADPSGPVVLEFSNGGCTDPAEEDTDIRDALLPISASVTLFDGGAGDAAAWSAALTGVDVLVLPEGCNFGTSYIDASAEAVIKAWVESGKTVVGTGSYTHAAFINYMTGLDYTSEFDDNDWLNLEPYTWDLQLIGSSLPATVPNGNYTGGLVNYSAWSADKKAFVTPVYYSEAEDNLGVAFFSFGSGYYIYNAYDWYPDEDDILNGVREAWNATLQLAVSGQITPGPGPEPGPEPGPQPAPAPAPQPELARTGSSDSFPILFGIVAAGSGLVLLLGARRLAARK